MWKSSCLQIESGVEAEEPLKCLRLGNRDQVPTQLYFEGVNAGEPISYGFQAI